jgi:DNA-directed RNA polymerase subunit omega
MKADLIEAASRIVPNHSILINMVSRRVRQLSLGHRPMVEVAPGLREADIALSEIINEKLNFESTFGQKEPETNVVKFPLTGAGKKRAA